MQNRNKKQKSLMNDVEIGLKFTHTEDRSVGDAVFCWEASSFPLAILKNSERGMVDFCSKLLQWRMLNALQTLNLVLY